MSNYSDYSDSDEDDSDVIPDYILALRKKPGYRRKYTPPFVTKRNDDFQNLIELSLVAKLNMTDRFHELRQVIVDGMSFPEFEEKLMCYPGQISKLWITNTLISQQASFGFELIDGIFKTVNLATEIKPVSFVEIDSCECFEMVEVETYEPAVTEFVTNYEPVFMASSVIVNRMCNEQATISKVEDGYSIKFAASKSSTSSRNLSSTVYTVKTDDNVLELQFGKPIIQYTNLEEIKDYYAMDLSTALTILSKHYRSHNRKLDLLKLTASFIVEKEIIDVIMTPILHSSISHGLQRLCATKILNVAFDELLINFSTNDKVILKRYLLQQCFNKSASSIYNSSYKGPPDVTH